MLRGLGLVIQFDSRQRTSHQPDASGSARRADRTTTGSCTRAAAIDRARAGSADRGALRGARSACLPGTGSLP
jgi:hypothetical protein